jgi:hypothetical protein
VRPREQPRGRPIQALHAAQVDDERRRRCRRATSVRGSPARPRRTPAHPAADRAAGGCPTPCR